MSKKSIALNCLGIAMFSVLLAGCTKHQMQISNDSQDVALANSMKPYIKDGNLKDYYLLITDTTIEDGRLVAISADSARFRAEREARMAAEAEKKRLEALANAYPYCQDGILYRAGDILLDINQKQIACKMLDKQDIKVVDTKAKDTKAKAKKTKK